MAQSVKLKACERGILLKTPKFCPFCKTELVVKLRDEVNRLTCGDATCGYVFWDNPIPVVAAIVEMDDDVVLVRSKGWPEKWFGLVTGFLEREETPDQAVLREINEELGLEAQISELIGVYSFEQRNELIIAYHVHGNGTIILGDELAEYKLISKNRLRAWGFGTGLAVQDWLKSRMIDEEQ